MSYSQTFCGASTGSDRSQVRHELWAAFSRTDDRIGVPGSPANELLHGLTVEICHPFDHARSKRARERRRVEPPAGRGHTKRA